ncbi:MAG: hypothetical protein LBT55_04460 [Clostridiaceae bacterium]|jgi:hypothetical protein|nr:hypothetical protein [Clostridiaceae bacterium]
MNNIKKKGKKIALGLVICIAILGGAAGIVFGIAFASAFNAAEVERIEAESLAVSFVKDEGIVGAEESVYILESELDFELRLDLASSYFEYDVDLITANGKEIRLTISTADGAVYVKEIKGGYRA